MVGMDMPSFPNIAQNYTPELPTVALSCEEIEEHQADEKGYLVERFYMCVVGGCTVSVVGMVCSAFLFRIFTRPAFTGTVYYVVLTVLDMAILVNYILLIGVGIAKDFFGSLELHEMWHSYVRPMFCLGRITQASQTYIIATATMDRFVQAMCKDRLKAQCNTLTRTSVVVLVLLFTTASKMTSYWEIAVYRNDSCTGFARLHAQPASTGFVQHHMYKDYKLYVDPVLHVYVPVTTLLFLNVGIIYRLKKDSSGRKDAGILTDAKVSEKRHDVRDAALTTIAIVMCYLIANILHVTMTLLEQMDHKFLNDHYKEYALAADVSSCLVILTTAVRLPVYWICNRKIRREIKLVFGCGNNVGGSRAACDHVRETRLLLTYDGSKFGSYSAAINGPYAMLGS